MIEKLPATFRDSKGRKWRLEFTIGHLKRLKEGARISFDDLREGRGFAVLSFDIEKLGRLLWLLCEEQAKELEVDEEVFGSSLDGDTLDQATQALEEAVINFTPTSLKSTVQQSIEMALKAMVEASDATLKLAEEQSQHIPAIVAKEAGKHLFKFNKGA